MKKSISILTCIAMFFALVVGASALLLKGSKAVIYTTLAEQSYLPHSKQTRKIASELPSDETPTATVRPQEILHPSASLSLPSREEPLTRATDDRILPADIDPGPLELQLNLQPNLQPNLQTNLQTKPIPLICPLTDVVASAAIPSVAHAENPVISDLKASVGFEYSRIDSTDKVYGGAASFVSNLNPVYKAEWALHWSPAFASFFNFGLKTVSINTAALGTKLGNADGTAKDFSFGAEYAWNESSRSRLQIGGAEEVFTHNLGIGITQLDYIFTPKVSLMEEFDLFERGGAKVGLRVRADVLGGSSGPGYSTQTGFGYDFAFYVEHAMKAVSLRAEVNYGGYNQSTDLENQHGADVGTNFGLIWRIN